MIFKATIDNSCLFQVRTTKKQQTEQKSDKIDNLKKFETKRVVKASKRPDGKGKTHRARKGINHDKNKGSANRTKNEVEETISSEMAPEVYLYEVTDLHNSTDIKNTACITVKSKREKRPEKTKTNVIVQNEGGPDEQKSCRNNQQNYENFDLEKTGGEQNTETEQELNGSQYANIIPDTRTPSTSSIDSSYADTSSSSEELYGNTKIIIQSKSVVFCQLFKGNT